MATRQEGAENELHDQTQVLPKREIIKSFLVLAVALLVCFIDQNGIGVLLPTIARELNARSSITWAGTSALIANTVFQVLYGRLSDLFGRKKIFIFALILLSLSDLGCGLSTNATMFYIFRGLAGIANGGITSIAMITVSDIVTLKQRGRYQGILGSMVGLGNALGPLIASAFAINLTWRGLFYMLSPLILVTVATSWMYLPTNMPKLNLRETLAKIDFLGVLTGSAGIILLLIPISDGGRERMPWSSPETITMLILGTLSLALFLIIEWKWAKLPMMPLSMFRKPSVAAMLLQSFLLGNAFYSLVYFLPLYFQNVREKTPLISAALILPLVITQAVFSPSCGWYMTKRDRYVETMWFGFGSWTLGGGLLTLASLNTSFVLTSFALFFVGMGAGCTFQPTLVALQAHCPKAQRAVVTSCRNTLRMSGAAIGLAISTAILTAVLRSHLPPELSGVADSAFAIPNLSDLSEQEREVVKSAFAAGSRAVFIYFVPLTGICFLLNIFIEDQGLVREEERAATAVAGSAVELDIATETITADLEKGNGGDTDLNRKSTGCCTVSSSLEASRTSSLDPPDQRRESHISVKSDQDSIHD